MRFTAKKSTSKSKWLGMKFGFHGFWACLTLGMTTIAILLAGNLVLRVTAMILNQILAHHAYSLLDQVPLQTVIIKNPSIIAPHREAFTRTIAVMMYANLRLLWWTLDTLMSRQWFWYFKHVLFLASWCQFVPYNSSFTNGNTYIFVIPMFVGVSFDICQMMLLREYCFSEKDLVTPAYLLGVNVAAMIMAFLFTLAFRAILNIRFVYFGAAAGVALLFVVGCWLIFASISSLDGDICRQLVAS